MPKQPPQCSSSSTPARQKLRAYYLLSSALGCCCWTVGGSSQPSALRHPQPVHRQPQQGGTHRLVLSAVCGVKTCSCTTPIFLAPTRHNEDPDRHYKRRPPRWRVQRSAQP